MMPVEPDSALHDFSDRAFRKSLEDRDNLRSFLKKALPDLADGFDYSRARPAPREFLLDDWRRREADLLFEIPYRDQDGERLTLVCILIEHQSKSDPRMPLRTLVYAVLYWDREWKAWEKAESPRPDFKLTPIVPIVLHTSPKPWSSARTFAELIAGPEVFRSFAPRWEPIFWELAGHSAGDLMNSRDAFLQLLAVVRAEDEDRQEFEAVYTEFLRQVEELYGTNRVRWYDLLRVVITWASWRRPEPEREHWLDVAQQMQIEQTHKREVEAMVRTIGEAMMEEAQSAYARKTLLFLGRESFGVPSEATEEAIKNIADLGRLDRMLKRIMRVKSWVELLEIE
jgi:hypothetical protein